MGRGWLGLEKGAGAQCGLELLEHQPSSLYVVKSEPTWQPSFPKSHPQVPGRRSEREPSAGFTDERTQKM